MKKIIFDIETKNTFEQVGSNKPEDLDISLMCLYDSETNQYHSFLYSELEKAWSFFEKADVLIGFNSEHFDIPLLNKYYHGNIANIKSIDLLKSIKESLGKRIKMDSVAEATLGINKSGDGLDAIRWWNSGEIEKIKKYCLDDVRITKELYEYALKNKKLKYKDRITSEIKEIEIDTSSWGEKEDNGMAQSLF